MIMKPPAMVIKGKSDHEHENDYVQDNDVVYNNDE